MKKKHRLLNNYKFKFHGEDITFVIIMAPILISIILFVFTGLFMALNSFIIRFILILLLLLIINYFKNNSIRNIYFYDNDILIKFIFGNIKKLKYSDIQGVHKKREGFLPIYIYLFELKKNSKIKKIYFSCPDSEIVLLREFLKEKKIKI